MFQNMKQMEKEIKKWKNNYKALEKSYIALKENIIKSVNRTKEYDEVISVTFLQQICHTYFQFLIHLLLV